MAEEGMTEEEWKTCDQPLAMLDCERMDGASQRKLRLFAVSCCRRVWRHLTDPLSREAVERAEEYADGKIGEKELGIASTAAWEAHLKQHDAAYYASQAATWVAGSSAGFAATGSLEDAISATICDADDPEDDKVFHAMVLRDIFGVPWRPVKVEPHWLTSTVLDLASLIYQERAFDRMPVLADALMDAGCDDEELLSHCRSEQLHVRGCWVVDLLLGKE
jgi:hypothetical protein